MYLLNVTYTKPSEEVTAHVETHSAWVKKYFTEGIFMAAGPKKEKNGGVILARGVDRATLDKILAEDSFVVHQVASYDIVDFDCKLAIPALELLQAV